MNRRSLLKQLAAVPAVAAVAATGLNGVTVTPRGDAAATWDSMLGLLFGPDHLQRTVTGGENLVFGVDLGAAKGSETSVIMAYREGAVGYIQSEYFPSLEFRPVLTMDGMDMRAGIEAHSLELRRHLPESEAWGNGEMLEEPIGRMTAHQVADDTNSIDFRLTLRDDASQRLVELAHRVGGELEQRHTEHGVEVPQFRSLALPARDKDHQPLVTEQDILRRVAQAAGLPEDVLCQDFAESALARIRDMERRRFLQ